MATTQVDASVCLVPTQVVRPQHAAHAAKIDEFLQRELSPVREGCDISVEPHLQKIKVVRSGVRLISGPFSGSSGVWLRVELRDRAGVVVGQKEFEVRSNGFKGTFSMGERDRNIIPVLARQVAEYVATSTSPRS